MIDRQVKNRETDGAWRTVIAALILIGSCTEERANVSVPFDDETWIAADPALPSIEPPVNHSVLEPTSLPQRPDILGNTALGSPVVSELTPETTQQTSCSEDTKNVYKIFSTRCVICHVSEGRGQGGFGGVLSAESMIATGHVVPGDPAHSPLYVRVESGDMPRSGARLTTDELATISNWITCGAQALPARRPVGAASDAGIISADSDATTNASAITSLDSALH